MGVDSSSSSSSSGTDDRSSGVDDALMDREELMQLRHLVDTANAPIFSIDTDGIVDSWNDAMTRITGFFKDEAIGESFRDMFVASQADREHVDAQTWSALMGDETRESLSLGLATKNGGVRSLL